MHCRCKPVVYVLRWLTRVCPQVGLEVGTLAIHLGTPGVVALVTLPQHRRPPHTRTLLYLSVHHLLFNVVLVQPVIVHVGHRLLLYLSQVREDTGHHVASGRRPLALLPLSCQVQRSVVLVTRVEHGQQTLRGEVYVMVHPELVGGAVAGRVSLIRRWNRMVYFRQNYLGVALALKRGWPGQ